MKVETKDYIDHLLTEFEEKNKKKMAEFETQLKRAPRGEPKDHSPGATGVRGARAGRGRGSSSTTTN